MHTYLAGLSHCVACSPAVAPPLAVSYKSRWRKAASMGHATVAGTEWRLVAKQHAVSEPSCHSLTTKLIPHGGCHLISGTHATRVRHVMMFWGVLGNATAVGHACLYKADQVGWRCMTGWHCSAADTLVVYQSQNNCMTRLSVSVCHWHAVGNPHQLP